MILERLGEGGMGTVYRAQDESLRRVVALKVLRREANAGGEQQHRLLREARAGAALSHPNVTTVYEVGQHEGQTYIAMEYIDGQTLRARMGAGGVALDTKLRWLAEVGRALAAAHAVGLVHRDVKPENVMITRDGAAKVLDFGIARVTSADMETRTRAEQAPTVPVMTPITAEGMTVGTPLYMAPEQMLGQAVDGRTDQFAWGLLAYELLAGRSPWHAAAVSHPSVQLVAEIVSDRAVDPLPASAAPSAVRAVVLRTLHKDPAKRFPSMQAVIEALGADAAGSTWRGAPGRRHVGGSTTRYAAVAILAAAVAATVLVVRRNTATDRPSAATGAAPSASAAAPGVTAFGDLLPSPTGSDAARAAFEHAMAAFAAGDDGQPALDDALRADPHFASAALQRAYAGFWLARPLSADERKVYRIALEGSADLSERDRAFLDALGPSFLDPPDWAESERRMRAFVSTRSGDVQGWDALAVLLAKQSRYREAPSAFEREAALAPGDVAGHLMWAQTLGKLGDREGAARVLADCSVRRPTNTACRRQAVDFAALRGDCARMDRLAREMTSISPDSPIAWVERARAAGAAGASETAIAELLSRAREHVPEALREGAEVSDKIDRAWREGDFVRMLQLLDRSEGGASQSTLDIGTLSSLETWRVEVLREIGERAGAARAAQTFLARLPALPLGERPSDDPTPELLAYAHDGGLMDAGTLRARRDAWIDAQRRTMSDEAWAFNRTAVWARAYDAPGEPTRAQADEAFTALRELGGELGEPDPYLLQVESVGALLFGAGRLDDAERWLTAAVTACDADPRARAKQLLARTLEAKGDAAGACRWYASVAGAWGRAKPRSLTAAAARDGASRLRCAKEP